MIERGLESLQRQTQSLTLPASFWDNVRERLTDENDLLRLWAPAYARQLTSAQIAELLEFYRSPAGVRYTAAIPAIQAESLEAGTQLARDAAKRAVREVFGPLPQWRMLHPPQPPPAPGASAP